MKGIGLRIYKMDLAKKIGQMVVSMKAFIRKVKNMGILKYLYILSNGRY